MKQPVRWIRRTQISREERSGAVALISTRRLAREWALKILYQSDIGKIPIAESQAAALERLRTEFVQRASRTATGSSLEEMLADAVTGHLEDVLQDYGPPLEQGLHASFTLLEEASAYWAELRIDFSFGLQSFNALWEVPRGADAVVLPAAYGALPRSVVENAALDDAQRQRLLRFLIWARTAMSEAAIRAFGRETKLMRPEGARLRETRDYVAGRWEHLGPEMGERWGPAVRTAERQACDWMRVAAFTLRLVTGVHGNREALDRSLQAHEIGWSMERQVSVDRNILRMAAFELKHLENVPTSATINEAVELAKKYSTAESGKFVNGVLGAIVATDASSKKRIAEAGGQQIADDIGETEVDMDEISNEEELAQV